MCQNCKKDIPIVNYRTHTLHCARNMIKCRECETMVGKGDLHSHQLEFHTLRLCNQCQVNVEAYKLPEHKKTLCSKRKLLCKYCNFEQLASEMTTHENRCGCRTERCEHCHDWIQLKEWDSHHGRFHGQLMRRFRERSVIANTNPNEDSSYSTPLPKRIDEEMLPCEFCEGMIPMRKLLEHQAECVNPTNVRRSESISNLSQLSSSSLSTYRPLSGIRYMTQSNTNSLRKSPPRSIQRKISAPCRFGILDSSHRNEIETTTTPTAPSSSNLHSLPPLPPSITQKEEESENKIPCEFCSEPQEMENLMKHQRACKQNPDTGDNSSGYDSLRKDSVRSYGINRTASAREARATTEDRTFGRSLSRQSSFTERSFSRRSDNMYPGQMYTRASLGLGRYTAGPDYAAATRRSALFDGYTGFAIYSSISQGLDEITYGGRRSRRNSITENNYSYQRRGSLTGSAFEYSSLVSATATATANAMSNTNRSHHTPSHMNSHDTAPAPIIKDSSESGVSSSPKSSTTLSRQDSTRYSSSIAQTDSAYDSLPPSVKSVSTTSTATSINVPPVTNGGVISRQESIKQSKSSSKIERKVSFSGADPIVLDQPQKPKRHKEKQEKERKKKPEPSKHCDDLFDQVSAKLRALEQLQQEETPEMEDLIQLEPESPLSRVPPTSLFPPSVKAQPTVPQVQQYKVVEPAQTSSLPSSSSSMSSSSISVRPATTTVNVSATVTLNGSHNSVKMRDVPSCEVITAKEDPPFYHPHSTLGISTANIKQLPKEDQPSVQPYCQPMPANQDKNDVVIIREKTRGGESKSGSKRNSLDNKTVQTLAQDLAAECAKAYALMESSLSKLSTDFAVGPFGLTPKNKKTRKSRATPTAPLK